MFCPCKTCWGSSLEGALQPPTLPKAPGMQHIPTKLCPSLLKLLPNEKEITGDIRKPPQLNSLRFLLSGGLSPELKNEAELSVGFDQTGPGWALLQRGASPKPFQPGLCPSKILKAGDLDRVKRGGR